MNTSQENLYEIPNCTICLSQLNQQLINLNCGHVFHKKCINTLFQMNKHNCSRCPCCQKSIECKEIRPIIFQLQKNQKALNIMKYLQKNVPAQEKDHIEVLLKSLKQIFSIKQSQQSKVYQLQKQLNDTKTSYNIAKGQFQAIKKQNQFLREQINKNKSYIGQIQKENFELRRESQDYKRKQSQHQNLRKYQQNNQNQKSIKNYKNELQSKGASAQQMAKQFFSMLLLKNLQCIQLKNKLANGQNIGSKDEQNNVLNEVNLNETGYKTPLKRQLYFNQSMQRAPKRTNGQLMQSAPKRMNFMNFKRRAD